MSKVKKDNSDKAKKSHYLNNKDFEEVIFSYIQDNDKYESELIVMLGLLIDRILLTFKFNVDYDDAKQECYVLCFKVLKNFTKEKGTAFNYFTTVILNNLKQMYTKNKKYNQKLNKYRASKGDVFIEAGDIQ